MSLRVLGNYERLLEVVEHEKIDKIIVVLADRRGKLPVQALLTCKLWGVDVEDGTTFYEKMSGKIMLENLRPSWIIFSADFSVSVLWRLGKRVADILLAALGLILVLPFILAIAALIKVDSSGSVLFTQERVGQRGKLFTLFKFRSMRVDAEATTGPVYADVDDVRVTRVGRWLRRFRLDEIPQLLNVLKGDMSFVGPRPERPFFIEQFVKEIPFYIQRLSVKPGITGWAQVNYTYGANVNDALEKLQLDLYYIKHMSLLLDLFILLKTVKITVLGEGAR